MNWSRRRCNKVLAETQSRQEGAERFPCREAVKENGDSRPRNKEKSSGVAETEQMQSAENRRRATSTTYLLRCREPPKTIAEAAQTSHLKPATDQVATVTVNCAKISKTFSCATISFD